MADWADQKGYQVRRLSGTATISCAGKEENQTATINDVEEWDRVVQVAKLWANEKRKNVTVNIYVDYSNKAPAQKKETAEKENDSGIQGSKKRGQSELDDDTGSFTELPSNSDVSSGSSAISRPKKKKKNNSKKDKKKLK